MYEELNCFEEALKHFGTRVEVICAMELGGRISAEDAYQMVKDELKEVKSVENSTKIKTANLYKYSPVTLQTETLDVARHCVILISNADKSSLLSSAGNHSASNKRGISNDQICIRSNRCSLHVRWCCFCRSLR